MAISSFNKRAKHLRVKITKQEVRSYAPAPGINVVAYPPEQWYTRIVDHGSIGTTKIMTQNSGIGERNIMLSVSGAHFEPLERRYQEDIERAIEKLNILDENVTPDTEPNHLEAPKIKDYNLQFMEHTTYVDNPTLDAVDKVRSIMHDKRTITINQLELKNLERKMTRNPLLYGVPSNAQAIPRFVREKNQGARNEFTGLKEYETEIGTY